MKMFFKGILCVSLVFLLGTYEVAESGQGVETGGMKKDVLNESLEQEISDLKTENEEVSITISAVGDCTFGSDKASPSSVNFYAVKKKHTADYC